MTFKMGPIFIWCYVIVQCGVTRSSAEMHGLSYGYCMSFQHTWNLQQKIIHLFFLNLYSGCFCSVRGTVFWCDPGPSFKCLQSWGSTSVWIAALPSQKRSILDVKLICPFYLPWREGISGWAFISCCMFVTMLPFLTHMLSWLWIIRHSRDSV